MSPLPSHEWKWKNVFVETAVLTQKASFSSKKIQISLLLHVTLLARQHDWKDLSVHADDWLTTDNHCQLLRQIFSMTTNHQLLVFSPAFIVIDVGLHNFQVEAGSHLTGPQPITHSHVFTGYGKEILSKMTDSLD